MRAPDLEAAIRANRDDRAVYQIYADWLIQHGSPLGDVMAMRLAGEPASDGLDPRLAEVHAPWGLWRVLRVHGDVEQLAPLFASPACGVLEELRVGVVTACDRLLDLASTHAWAGALRSLNLGDVITDWLPSNRMHLVVGEVGRVISEAFPDLRWLSIAAGELGLEGLALPKLEVLELSTLVMTRARLAAVLAAELPALRRLSLFFGPASTGTDATLAELAPLLEGRCHAGVVDLAVANFEDGDQLARALVDSPIAARLESLDLSLGTLGDVGAALLATSAARFPRLRRLDVNDCFVSDEGIARLNAAFHEVIDDGQRHGDVRTVEFTGA